jgi:DNA helicase-2/ATP-dependent DNA helicase PcrA
MQKKILQGLNPQQEKAVTYGDGPLLVLAGAGSGKTRVLTHRIAYLIANGVPAYNFIAVTFTNKAAAEMMMRVRNLVERDVWVSTFHSSCLRILKRESKYTPLGEQFSIYDDSDQILLIKECLKEKNLDDKQFIPKKIKEKISWAKDSLITPQAMAEESGSYYEEKVCQIYELYQQKLHKYKGVDFGGLIQECINLFQSEPMILKRYQERFQYVLIDEYQDTNHAQYKWITLLAEGYRNLTVVGDPDQSIYGWRGADIDNILSFEHDYPDAAVVKLDKNYRSTQNILDASNALITHNKSRKEKDLWTDKEKGDLLYVYQARDEKDESEFVVKQILEERSETCTLRDMVIFYRVHAQSRVLEDSLRYYNIPYKIVGGVRFYDRKEIKDIIAYMRVLVQPSDDVSLKRILNVPTRGIGERALDQVDEYKKHFDLTLFSALLEVDSIPGVSARARNSIRSFTSLIQRFRANEENNPPSKRVSDLLSAIGYLDLLEKEATFEARSRIENIKEFIGVITEFEEGARGSDDQSQLMASFLDTISLESNIDTWNENEGVVTLMTMHTAKGLEFDVVFLVGMEEDIFPHANVLESSHRELEEERRLCYVAITRSRKKVYFSYAESRRLYGNRMQNFPSRFLKEIPAHFLSHLNTKLFDIDPFDIETDEDVLEYDFL